MDQLRGEMVIGRITTLYGHRQTDIETDRHTDRQADIQTNRQTHLLEVVQTDQLWG